jgi:hypothetical protein
MNEDGKVFAEVFVCPVCYELAERMYKRTEGELRGLLLILKDKIREMIVQGKLHYSTEPKPGPLSKTDLLQAIMVVEEEKDDFDRRQVSSEVSGARLRRAEDH